MKNRLVLLAILLALPLAAEEANPFVKKKPGEKPPAPSGEPFMVVEEQILVAAERLDAWLEKNPLNEDAASLRSAVQTWIQEGAAQLDHTAISTGTMGRSFECRSIREQIYATEYMPPQPGEWPMPTAFETRNIGYSLEGFAGLEDGAVAIRSKMDFCGMLPHRSWDELAEKTRRPDDVFIPLFRYISIESASGPGGNNDPFDPSPKVPDSSTFIPFKPGVTYLAGRSGNELPEPAVDGRPATNAVSVAKDPHRKERLFFFRGTITQTPAVNSPGEPVSHHVSAKLVRVKHKTLSDWLRTSDHAQVPLIAWSAVKDWEKTGEAKITGNLTSPNTSGSTIKIGDVEELIYPTEYEPGKRLPATDGKPSQLEFCHPTAFETRHIGTSLSSEVLPDPGGPLLRVMVERVADGGKSVHYRILRDGEWKEDITFPVFSTNYWHTELRLRRGEWMLVGSGSDIDERGKHDPAHAVLTFVKVE